MRKLSKSFIGLLCCFMMLALFAFAGNSAFAAEVLPTDQESPRTGNIMIGVTGTFYNSKNGQEMLREVNLIRYRACRSGDWKYNTNNGRPGDEKLQLDNDFGDDPTDAQLAEKNGDYVPLKWSAELERIAEIRSVEGEIKLAHQRPNNNNEGADTMLVNGYGFNAHENMTWAPANSSAETFGINNWYGEREDYLNKDEDGNYGHYANMINMNNTYMAISAFGYPKDAKGEKPDYPSSVVFVACPTPEAGSAYPEHLFFAGVNIYTHEGFGVNSSDYTMTETPRALTGEYTQKVEADSSTVSAISVDGPSVCCPGSSIALSCNAKFKFNYDQQLGDYYSTSTWPIIQGVTWTSSDPLTAKVDDNGTVTAVNDAQTSAAVASLQEAELMSASTVTITATAGGQSGTKDISIAHIWNDGEVTKAATCTEKGVITYTCTRCGATKTKDLEKDSDNHTNIEVVDRKAATCTEKGYTGDTKCTACGTVLEKGSEIPALGHNWSDWKVTKEATCTEEGERTSTCSRCNKTRTETISKLEHAFSESVVTKEPTCEETGIRSGKCTRCGLETSETIPALGHSWDDGVMTKEATCVSKGVKTFTCTRCNKTKTEETAINPENHVNVVTINAVEATCTDPGYSGDKKCNDCGKTIEKGKVVPAKGHTWDEGKVTKAATCTEDGVKTYTCTVCGETKAEAIPMTDHNWDEGKVTKEASCTEKGEKLFTCKDCGATRTETIDALGHDWNEGKISKAATCVEKGVIEYTCSRCGTTEERELPVDPNNHVQVEVQNAKEATCTEDGYTGDKVCKACEKIVVQGEEIAATGHQWDEGVVVQNASVGQEGEKRYTCKTCGAVMTEKIPALSADQAAAENAAGSPKTGVQVDSPFVWIVLGAFVLSLVLGLRQGAQKS